MLAHVWPMLAPVLGHRFCTQTKETAICSFALGSACRVHVCCGPRTAAEFGMHDGAMLSVAGGVPDKLPMKGKSIMIGWKLFRR